MNSNSYTHKLAAISPLLFRLGDIIGVFASAYVAQYIRFGNIQLQHSFYILVLPTTLLLRTVTNYKHVYTSLRGQ